VRELAVLDVDDAADDVIEELAVVRHQQQRSLESLQPPLQPQHRVEVQVVGRLVEHQHVGARHERTRHVGAHLQATRQLHDRTPDVLRRESETVGELRGARGRGVAARVLVVAEQVCLLHAIVRGARFLQRVFDLHQPRVAAADVLEHGGLGTRQFLRDRHEIQFARNRVVAGVRPELAAQQRQQAGLAAAVAADDADLVAAKYGEIGAVEEHRCAAAQAQVT